MEDIKKHTQEEANNFSLYLKDSLCRVYRFIERFKDDPNHQYVAFTRHGIALVYQKFYGYTEQKVIDTFLNNLDVIKVLYDNQPEYLVTHSFYYEEEEKWVKENETVFGYDKAKLNYSASLKHRRASPNHYKLSLELVTK